MPLTMTTDRARGLRRWPQISMKAGKAFVAERSVLDHDRRLHDMIKVGPRLPRQTYRLLSACVPGVLSRPRPRGQSYTGLAADHDQIVSRRDAHGLRESWVAVKLCTTEITD